MGVLSLDLDFILQLGFKVHVRVCPVDAYLFCLVQYACCFYLVPRDSENGLV